MSSSQQSLLDAAGHRRSPATIPGYHRGRAPRNKGLRFPADPPTVEEIIAVMRATGDGPDGARLRALIVIVWRAGLRISEALDLAETDLDRSRGAVTVRRGKGGRRREVGMDRWAWDQLSQWLEIRVSGLRSARRSGRIAVLRDPRQHRWPALGGIRGAQAAAPNGAAGWCASPVRPASAPTRARRRARARGRAVGGHPAPAGARQPRDHVRLLAGNLQGIDSAEIIDTVHSRPAPVISATSGLRGTP